MNPPVVHTFWQQRYHAEDDRYDCPNCSKQMKLGVGGPTAKNPGKAFFGCNERFGGCGMFCWAEEAFKPKGAKRGRDDNKQGGTVIRGPVAAMPSALDADVADLRARVERLEQSLKK